MPKTKIGAQDDAAKQVLISNIKYEMDLRGYKKSDLRKVLGLSDPAINQRFKDPKWFRVGELLLIARWLRIPFSNLFIKKVADKISA